MGYTTEFTGSLLIEPPLTVEQQDVLHRLATAEHDESTMPGRYCQWVVGGNGTSLEWDGGEKFYDYVEWLEYIVRMLSGWDRVVNGRLLWRGESIDDIGTIEVADSTITVREGFVDLGAW